MKYFFPSFVGLMWPDLTVSQPPLRLPYGMPFSFFNNRDRIATLHVLPHKNTRFVLNKPFRKGESARTHFGLNVEEFVGSVPVELRLAYLDNLLLDIPLAEIHRLRVLRDPVMRDNWFLHYALSSLFIEAGIVRLLIRFATGYRRPEEIAIANAIEMVEYIRDDFEKNHKIDMSFLTPDLLLRWYSMVRFERGAQIYLNKSEIDLKSGVNDTTLLNFGIEIWRELLIAPWRDQLLLTGYDNIDISL